MVVVQDTQISWLMERHGIPDFIRPVFEKLIESDLNESNYLDGIFYRYKQVISSLAASQGLELTPKSYEVEKAEEYAQSEQEKDEVDKMKEEFAAIESAKRTLLDKEINNGQFKMPRLRKIVEVE